MIAIYDKFNALPQEKRERILNAAFREFGKYGYDKTSMEQVAVEAGISKGMVFHYFGSKRGLYELLYREMSSFFESYYGNMEEALAGLDYLEQYEYISKLKLQAYLENADVFEFMTRVYLNPERADQTETTQPILQKLTEDRIIIWKLINQSKHTGAFREGLDPERIKKYITWVLESYGNELMQRFKGKNLSDIDLNPYWAEFDVIMDDLRTVFYKSERRK